MIFFGQSEYRPNIPTQSFIYKEHCPPTHRSANASFCTMPTSSAAIGQLGSPVLQQVLVLGSGKQTKWLFEMVPISQGHLALKQCWCGVWKNHGVEPQETSGSPQECRFWSSTHRPASSWLEWAWWDSWPGSWRWWSVDDTPWGGHTFGCCQLSSPAAHDHPDEHDYQQADASHWDPSRWGGGLLLEEQAWQNHRGQPWCCGYRLEA